MMLLHRERGRQRALFWKCQVWSIHLVHEEMLHSAQNIHVWSSRESYNPNISFNWCQFLSGAETRKSSASTKFTRERRRKVGRGEHDRRPQLDNYSNENQNMKGKETWQVSTSSDTSGGENKQVWSLTNSVNKIETIDSFEICRFY